MNFLPENSRAVSIDHNNPFPNRSCLNCCWWRKNGFEGPTGVCQRYAPVLNDLRDRPITNADAWCGDWQELVTPRLMISGRGGGAVYYWMSSTARSQDFDTRGAAIEAEGLGTIEWRNLY